MLAIGSLTGSFDIKECTRSHSTKASAVRMHTYTTTAHTAWDTVGMMGNGRSASDAVMFAQVYSYVRITAGFDFFPNVTDGGQKPLNGTAVCVTQLAVLVARAECDVDERYSGGRSPNDLVTCSNRCMMALDYCSSNATMGTEDTSKALERLLHLIYSTSAPAAQGSFTLKEESDGRALAAGTSCAAGVALAEVPWLTALPAQSSLKVLQDYQAAGKGECTFTRHRGAVL